MKAIIRSWAGSTSVWGLGASILGLFITLVIGWLAVAPLPVQAQTPEYLKYLGHLHSQGLIDEYQDVAIAGDNGRFLVMASVTGLSIVEREAIKSGIVESPFSQFFMDRSLPSNLDGAPLETQWAPKFYEVIGSGPYLYVASRWDGLWIFRLEDNGEINEVRRLMRPREFTESVKILDDKMFLTHHADGIEVLDLADPGNPQTLAILGDGFVDAWGIAPEADGSVWVADGMGGVKLARWNGDQLVHVTGETLGTSPGVVQDVAVVGNWVVGAVAGQGVAVYNKSTAARVRTFPLEGVCVDLEPIDNQRVAVSCNNWVHVIELGAGGQPSIVASTRLHRREQFNPRFIPSHQAYRLAWDGEVLYVGGWHFADAYQLVADDPDDDPDIQVSGQRAHFGTAPAVASFRIANAGEGALNISEVTCPAAIECNLDSARLQPGASVELTLSYDGTSPGLRTQVDILSDDPDDGLVRINVFTPVDDNVDPQETAPDFTGNFVTYDYVTQTFTETRLSLSDFIDAGQAVHLGFFGGFCPACAWKGASVAADITASLPQGAVNILNDTEEAQAPVKHMMEKLHLPVGFMFSDTADNVYRQYDNVGSRGLPAFRDYIINPAGTVTTVLANEYSPDKILDALEDAVGDGPPPEGADLSVSKSDSPDPVQVGETLTYALQVQNNGPDSATSVVLTDTLPSSVTFVSATPGQGSCGQAAGVVTCNLGTLANGGLATVTVLVTPTAAGTISNTVGVAASETDPNPGNNTASVTTTVGTPSSEPLNILDVSPDVVAPGGVTQLTAVGSGFEAGAQVQLCKKTPGVTINGVNVVDAGTMLVDITVPADAQDGQCGFRVINPDGETDTLLPAFTIEASSAEGADLSVSKSDNPDPVQVGQNLTYSLQVQNNGPDSATSVVLTDTLPSSVTFVSATPGQGSCGQAAGVVTCNLGTLANGGLATVTVLATPTAAGTISNAVSVAASETDPNPGNNTASVTTTVEASPADGADLSVSKSDSPDPVQVDQTLTYTLQVQNNGPDSATSVVLTDTLPSSVTFVSATPGQGSCGQAAGVVTCNLGTLANGGLATVTVLVTPTAAGTISNTVGVAASETDPNPGNNTASVTTTVGTPSSEPLNILDVSPDVVAPGGVTQLTAVGSGFQAGAQVQLCKNTPGITINGVNVVDAGTMLVDITVPADAQDGRCGFRVINPDGETDTLLPAFTIE